MFLGVTHWEIEKIRYLLAFGGSAMTKIGKMQELFTEKILETLLRNLKKKSNPK